MRHLPVSNLEMVNRPACCRLKDGHAPRVAKARSSPFGEKTTGRIGFSASRNRADPIRATAPSGQRDTVDHPAWGLDAGDWPSATATTDKKVASTVASGPDWAVINIQGRAVGEAAELILRTPITGHRMVRAFRQVSYRVHRQQVISLPVWASIEFMSFTYVD